MTAEVVPLFGERDEAEEQADRQTVTWRETDTPHTRAAQHRILEILFTSPPSQRVA